MFSDLVFILEWWGMLFLIGFSFLPLTFTIFSKFYDRGYIFSKILGIALISYAIFILSTVRLVSFTRFNSISISISLIIFLLLLGKLNKNLSKNNLISILKEKWKLFFIEEAIFLITLFFWSVIRAHQPDIHNIEKFMDYGFVNSALRSNYFPPKDMWFANFSINYYYFGHLVTAILTKISGINSSITYNLMIAGIFSFIFTESFSIALNLLQQIKKIGKVKMFLGSLLTAFLVTLSGNLQTIYAFFASYKGDSPIPFWQLTFSPQTFPNSYWYPSATRFIYHTIHEFPSYALTLSDLHGHLLDTPFVLFTIALLFSVFLMLKTKGLAGYIFLLSKTFTYWFLISLLLAIMYMTNAWDGILYFLLTIAILGIVFLSSVLKEKQKINIYSFTPLIRLILLIGFLFFIFTLPFNLFYKPPVSGLGFICSPDFLMKIGRIGPFVFETQHCQHSQFWELLILYGFFYFWIISFLIFVFKNIRNKSTEFNLSDNFLLILILCASSFILIPEFIYFKDIFTSYPRANTMFKISYQVFILLALSSGYVIVRLSQEIKPFIKRGIPHKAFISLYLFLALIIISLISIYPFFAINSYYNGLNKYYGLNGINYLKKLYPSDYDAILWINKNIKGQPTMLEAQGDSYTDYERVSVNTGLPTIIGWTVHEWFWRNNYDVVSPRIEDVKIIYETNNISLAKTLIKKYNVSYIFIGVLERQKYLNLNENKFEKMGKIIYQIGRTKVFKISL